MLQENKVFIIQEDDANRRIDRVLRKFLKDYPLSKIYSAIRKGKIKINGKKVKQNQVTQKGDELEISKFLFYDKENKKISVKTSDIKQNLKTKNSNQKESKKDLNILLKTNHLLFINKKQGEIVHGENSISDLVLENYKPKQESLSFAPGPLHRLDKDTSGIICFSQSLKGAQVFSDAIKTKKLSKYYLGIVEGLNIKSVLDSPIDGKACKTLCKVIKSNKEKNLSLVEFKLITGRKHQIRIQCQKAGHPLLNDRKYGSKLKNNSGKHKKYFLHAQRIVFDDELLKLEAFKGVPKLIEASIPEYFDEVKI